MAALVLSKVYRPFCRSKKVIYCAACWSSKVPASPTWTIVDESTLPQVTHISKTMINHLERLALVEFGNEEGIERLTKAIRFADQMMLVDTTGVEPMTSVLEDRATYLRQDEVKTDDCRKDLLKLAKKTVEEYYVSPPGNIPLEKKQQESTESVSSNKIPNVKIVSL